MANYIIGIDGGGTKTLGVLFDEKGNEIDRFISGFSTFSVDEKVAKENIIKTIDQLYKNIDIYHDTVHIQMGIAGASKLRNKDDYTYELASKYNSSVKIVSDAEIALYSISKNENLNVIMVLGGTGSVVIGKNEISNDMIGGFGHLLGDEGSGYHLAITALKDIISEYENNHEFSEFSKMILKEINANDHYDIKDFVYNNKKSEIAKLSLFISKLANKGNVEAKNLFINEGIHLARQTYSAYKRLNTSEMVIVSIKGGFLLNAPFVKETMFKELDKYKMNYKIFEEQVEPVIGAYHLGLKEILKR